MSKKVIIIHGYDSAPTKTKYTLISMALTEREIEHVIPALPGREHPNHKEWLEIINKEVQSATQPVVLVGHSLGTRAALLYLDQFDVKIDTVILIASFNNATENRSDGYANFFEHPLDLEKVKSRAKKFIVLHSKDDSAIDYKEGTMMMTFLDILILCG